MLDCRARSDLRIDTAQRSGLSLIEVSEPSEFKHIVAKPQTKSHRFELQGLYFIVSEPGEHYCLACVSCSLLRPGDTIEINLFVYLCHTHTHRLLDIEMLLQILSLLATGQLCVGATRQTLF